MSLQQLTTIPNEITPEKLGIDVLKNQITEIAGLSFPALDGLPTSGDVSLPDLSMLTDLVGGFEQMTQTFGGGPEALIGDLRGLLDDMRNGSVDITSRCGAISAVTDNLDQLPQQLLGAFEQFGGEIVPLFEQFQQQPTDATAIIDMFHLQTLGDTLQQQFTAPLQAPLEQLDTLTSLVEPLDNLADQPWLTGYADLLQQVINGEPAALEDPALVESLHAAVGSLNGQIAGAAATLGQFSTGLERFSHSMTATLEQVLARLDPHNLLQMPPMVEQALQQLENLQFGNFIAPIEQAATTVDALLGQQIDQVIDLIDQGIAFIVGGIGQARQLLVKVQAIATDLIGQLTDFIGNLNISETIAQGKQAFSSFATTISGVLDQVNGVIVQVFDFIDQVIDQLQALDFRPLIQQLHTVLYRVVGVLDDPQVRQVTDQVKAGIDLVIQHLDQIGFNLIVDQVVTQADQMKATLAAVDVSQLNALLRQALGTALDLVQEQIDPPGTKITQPILAQFDEHVMQPVATLLEPVQAQITAILDIIHTLEPGTLVSREITPFYDELAGRVRAWLDREQIMQQLGGVTTFYASLIATIDTHANPEKLLAPLLTCYNTLQEFIDQLNPQTLLAPLEELLDVVRNQIAGLDVNGLIRQIKAPVAAVVQQITAFRLEEQPFWEPVQRVLDIQPQELLDNFIQQIRQTINRLDLAVLEPVMAGLRPALDAITGTITQNQLPDAVERIITTIEGVQRQVVRTLTGLQSKWEDATRRNLPAALQARLQTLQPVQLLGPVTRRLDQMLQAGRSMLVSLRQIWQSLQQQLAQGSAFLERLLSEGAAALQDFLRQLLDTLVAGPLARVVNLLNEPLAGIRRAVATFLSLQDHLGVLTKIPETIDRIGGSIAGLQRDLTAFNLGFLTEGLQDLIKTVTQPLAELNPQFLIDELTALYRQILGMLETLNPEQIIDAARGRLTLQRGDATGEQTIPSGTRFVATTPVGTASFRTIQGGTLAPDAAEISLLVQADTAGATGNIIRSSAESDEVTWQIVADSPPELAGLTPVNPEPLLSLLTRVQQIVFAQLEALHPDKLLAEPLNDIYAQIVARLDELGLERLLDALFERFQRLDQELNEEMNRAGAALGGMLAAMPL